jgi:hypothetical protein
LWAGTAQLSLFLLRAAAHAPSSSSASSALNSAAGTSTAASSGALTDYASPEEQTRLFRLACETMSATDLLSVTLSPSSSSSSSSSLSSSSLSFSSLSSSSSSAPFVRRLAIAPPLLADVSTIVRAFEAMAHNERFDAAITGAGALRLLARFLWSARRAHDSSNGTYSGSGSGNGHDSGSGSGSGSSSSGSGSGNSRSSSGTGGTGHSGNGRHTSNAAHEHGGHTSHGFHEHRGMNRIPTPIAAAQGPPFGPLVRRTLVCIQNAVDVFHRQVWTRRGWNCFGGKETWTSQIFIQFFLCARLSSLSFSIRMLYVYTEFHVFTSPFCIYVPCWDFYSPHFILAAFDRASQRRGAFLSQSFARSVGALAGAAAAAAARTRRLLAPIRYFIFFFCLLFFLLLFFLCVYLCIVVVLIVLIITTRTIAAIRNGDAADTRRNRIGRRRCAHRRLLDCARVRMRCCHRVGCSLAGTWLDGVPKHMQSARV